MASAFRACTSSSSATSSSSSQTRAIALLQQHLTCVPVCCASPLPSSTSTATKQFLSRNTNLASVSASMLANISPCDISSHSSLSSSSTFQCSLALRSFSSLSSGRSSATKKSHTLGSFRGSSVTNTKASACGFASAAATGPKPAASTPPPKVVPKAPASAATPTTPSHITAQSQTSVDRAQPKEAKANISGQLTDNTTPPLAPNLEQPHSAVKPSTPPPAAQSAALTSSSSSGLGAASASGHVSTTAPKTIVTESKLPPPSPPPSVVQSPPKSSASTGSLLFQLFNLVLGLGIGLYVAQEKPEWLPQFLSKPQPKSDSPAAKDASPSTTVNLWRKRYEDALAALKAERERVEKAEKTALALKAQLEQTTVKTSVNVIPATKEENSAKLFEASEALLVLMLDDLLYTVALQEEKCEKLNPAVSPAAAKLRSQLTTESGVLIPTFWDSLHTVLTKLFSSYDGQLQALQAEIRRQQALVDASEAARISAQQCLETRIGMAVRETEQQFSLHTQQQLAESHEPYRRELLEQANLVIAQNQELLEHEYHVHRVEQNNAIAELVGKLHGIEEFLSRPSTFEEASQRLHRLALALAAVENAEEAGTPLGNSFAELLAVAKSDEWLHTVLQHQPPIDAAEHGIVSEQVLELSFNKSLKEWEELSFLPTNPSDRSLFRYLFAKLLTVIAVYRHQLTDGIDDGGKLTNARVYIQRKQFDKALQELNGLQRKDLREATDDWRQAAAVRLSLLQTVKAVRARVNALTIQVNADAAQVIQQQIDFGKNSS